MCLDYSVATQKPAADLKGVTKDEAKTEMPHQPFPAQDRLAHEKKPTKQEEDKS